ncbi:MAG: helix-turn-helix transcriptional regulator [Acidobacteria bacterium]|jgi:transcriptional regulator GlxA family with amidase domain|nr:helix-turn-helix transcriptional regulator [Acidobacteriota bacterium]
MDYRIEEILTKINVNLSQKLTAKNLAEFVSLSTSRFQHLFIQEVGTGIVKYIKELRLQKACELLETTNLNVQEIRVIIGTTDGTHFFRDFKEKFGSTPSEYRKNFTNSRNGG